MFTKIKSVIIVVYIGILLLKHPIYSIFGRLRFKEKIRKMKMNNLKFASELYNAFRVYHYGNEELYDFCVDICEIFDAVISERELYERNIRIQKWLEGSE